MSGEVRVLLDSRSGQTCFLESAAFLAKVLRGRLRGLLVEDLALLQAAELPFVQEISLWSAEERDTSAVSMARSFRAYARHIERKLEQIALRERIEWSFQSVSGSQVQRLLENGSTNGFAVVAGESGQIRRAGQNRDKAPVDVFFTGSAVAERAMLAALEIAGGSHRPLVVRVNSGEGGEESQTTLQQRARALLGDTPAEIDFRPMDELRDAPAFLRALGDLWGYAAVLPADLPLLREPGEFQRLIHLARSLVILAY